MGKNHPANNASPAPPAPKMFANPPVTPGWIDTKITAAVKAEKKPKRKASGDYDELYAVVYPSKKPKPKRRVPVATRDEPLAKKGPKHRKPRR